MAGGKKSVLPLHVAHGRDSEDSHTSRSPPPPYTTFPDDREDTSYGRLPSVTRLGNMRERILRWFRGEPAYEPVIRDVEAGMALGEETGAQQLPQDTTATAPLPIIGNPLSTHHAPGTTVETTTPQSTTDSARQGPSATGMLPTTQPDGRVQAAVATPPSAVATPPAGDPAALTNSTLGQQVQSQPGAKWWWERLVDKLKGDSTVATPDLVATPRPASPPSMKLLTTGVPGEFYVVDSTSGRPQFSVQIDPATPGVVTTFPAPRIRLEELQTAPRESWISPWVWFRFLAVVVAVVFVLSFWNFNRSCDARKSGTASGAIVSATDPAASVAATSMVAAKAAPTKKSPAGKLLGNKASAWYKGLGIDTGGSLGRRITQHEERYNNSSDSEGLSLANDDWTGIGGWERAAFCLAEDERDQGDEAREEKEKNVEEGMVWEGIVGCSNGSVSVAREDKEGMMREERQGVAVEEKERKTNESLVREEAEGIAREDKGVAREEKAGNGGDDVAREEKKGGVPRDEKRKGGSDEKN